MTEGYSGGMPAQPPVSAPGRRGGMPTWLIVVLIVLLVCIVGAVLVCVLSGGALALLGPLAGNAFNAAFNATLGCQLENPGLGSNACSDWVTNLTQNHQDEMDACQSIISGNDNSSDTASRYYNCLIDEGVPPPQ